jgi:hypothetical protein
MMKTKTPMTGRIAPRILAGSLATLWLLAPALARPMESPQEKVEAARVAKKVEKAKSAKHEAREELEGLQRFQRQVDKYARIHENQLARLGKQEAVTAKALADAIEADRAKARQGDVFVPEVQPLLRHLIAEQLKGPDTQAAVKAVVEGNPSKEAGAVPVVPRVNAVYPSGATRSTVPPSLLFSLPPLPECLHYRFVNRDLILVDSVAQIIVDYLPAAAPALGVK